jgi:uncharacterized protein (DUF697 family)
LLVVPQTQRESISDLILAMESKVGFYMVGQGVLCMVMGILALIAYLLIGLPNALVLALIAGVLEAVPVVGPLLGAIPAALVALGCGSFFRRHRKSLFTNEATNARISGSTFVYSCRIRGRLSFSEILNHTRCAVHCA